MNSWQLKCKTIRNAQLCIISQKMKEVYFCAPWATHNFSTHDVLCATNDSVCVFYFYEGDKHPVSVEILKRCFIQNLSWSRYVSYLKRGTQICSNRKYILKLLVEIQNKIFPFPSVYQIFSCVVLWYVIKKSYVNQYSLLNFSIMVFIYIHQYPSDIQDQ